METCYFTRSRGILPLKKLIMAKNSAVYLYLPTRDLKEDWDPALMGGTMKLNFTGNLLNKMDNNRLPQFITKNSLLFHTEVGTIGAMEKW